MNPSPRAPSPGTVTVIIPVRDDDRLFACVDSVLRSHVDSAVKLQLLVVDNASTPAFSERLAALPPPTTVLHEPREGAYAARNRGLDAARGDAVFFTDADCVVGGGWIAQGLAALDSYGADIVLGYNGQVPGAGPAQRLVQARHDAAFRRLAPGQATEIDTKNLAVRRRVFDRLRFDDRYLRVGDTEFGLVAESLGFRIAYCPAMRVDHDNAATVTEFVAKQVCHGWGAQRIMRQHPETRWHGGHLRLVSRVSHALTRVPFRQPASLAVARAAVAAARGFDRLGPGRVPFPVAYRAVYALDKLGAAAGHLMYEAGREEPRLSTLVGRKLPRD